MLARPRVCDSESVSSCTLTVALSLWVRTRTPACSVALRCPHLANCPATQMVLLVGVCLSMFTCFVLQCCLGACMVQAHPRRTCVNPAGLQRLWALHLLPAGPQDPATAFLYYGIAHATLLLSNACSTPLWAHGCTTGRLDVMQDTTIPAQTAA